MPNINGVTSIKSWPGFYNTIIMYVILSIYAANNAQILILKLNPNISFNTQVNYYDDTNVVDIMAIGFKIAIGVEDFNTR